jgi:hypothetical protein
MEYGTIAERTYFRGRNKLMSDKTRDTWFSHITRIEFVEIQKKLIEDLKRSYDDTMHQLFVEERKDPRNEGLIIRLKKDQTEAANVLSEFSLGNPIIAGIKNKLDRSDQGIEFHYRL